MPRILSGNRAIGRPSPRVWTNKSVQNVSNTAKASVRRLFRRDPADGVLGPGGDKITTTHIDIVNPNPREVSRPRTAPPNAGKKVVQDRSANRSIEKR